MKKLTKIATTALMLVTLAGCATSSKQVKGLDGISIRPSYESSQEDYTPGDQDSREVPVTRGYIGDR